MKIINLLCFKWLSVVFYSFFRLWSINLLIWDIPLKGWMGELLF